MCQIVNTITQWHTFYAHILGYENFQFSITKHIILKNATFLLNAAKWSYILNGQMPFPLIRELFSHRSFMFYANNPYVDIPSWLITNISFIERTIIFVGPFFSILACDLTHFPQFCVCLSTLYFFVFSS